MREENQHSDTVKAYRQGYVPILTAVKFPSCSKNHR